MEDNKQLEHYLTRLDKALGAISVSDRSEIILEIKSHVLRAQEKDPQEATSQILSSLGDPETVANRYLLERGLKPGKPARTPVIKWLTIGVLGTFGIFCVFIISMIMFFSPLIVVDEKNDHVQLLGGLIDINGSAESVKIGNLDFNSVQNYKNFEGQVDLKAQKINSISVPFTNGKLELQKSKNGLFTYDCKVSGTQAGKIDSIEGNTLRLGLQESTGAKCDLFIPEKIAMNITGNNGKVELMEPTGDVTLSINNGKVEISPDKNLKYRYDLNVGNGKIDRFESLDDKDSLVIKVSVANGAIKRSDVK